MIQGLFPAVSEQATQPSPPPSQQPFSAALQEASCITAPQDLARVAEAAARAAGVPVRIFLALVTQESGWDPRAVSSAGAMGLCQLMPATAEALGVNNPFDPVESLFAGARYLAEQLRAFGGDVALALAAYNAGPETVRRWGGVPPYPETQDYVRSVLSLAARVAP